MKGCSREAYLDHNETFLCKKQASHQDALLDLKYTVEQEKFGRDWSGREEARRGRKSDGCFDLWRPRLDKKKKKNKYPSPVFLNLKKTLAIIEVIVTSSLSSWTPLSRLTCEQLLSYFFKEVILLQSHKIILTVYVE